jgi:Ca2+/H+ antiporter, TMEM165/GDT1 family
LSVRHAAVLPVFLEGVSSPTAVGFASGREARSLWTSTLQRRSAWPPSSGGRVVPDRRASRLPERRVCPSSLLGQGTVVAPIDPPSAPFTLGRPVRPTELVGPDAVQDRHETRVGDGKNSRPEMHAPRETAMNTKVLFASFALVFLAELGDKTQLTALAFAASSKSPWAVFFGTSLALITTTALAVIFGEMLSRVLPERVLHIGSGVMFVLVGLVLLVNEARKVPAVAPMPEPAETSMVQPAGFLSRMVLRHAILFETEMVDALESATEVCDDAALRQGLEEVTKEDHVHIESLKELVTGIPQADDEPDTGASEKPETVSPPAPVADALAAMEGIEADEADSPFHKLIQKQEAIAEFYIALARMSHLHDARDTLRWLAMEEIRHAQHLCSLINHDDQPA